MTTWSQVEKDTGFGFIVTVSLPAVLTKTVLRREELRPETLTKSEGFSETRVLPPPPPPQCPKHSRSWPSSSTGSMRLRRRLRSNFPKGLRLISSHTGAERERGEWEQGRVASGKEGAGWRSPPPNRQAVRQP